MKESRKKTNTKTRSARNSASAAERQARIANFSPEEYQRYIGASKHKRKRTVAKPSQPRSRDGHQVRDQELRDKRTQRLRKKRNRSIAYLVIGLALVVIMAVAICGIIFFKVSSVAAAGCEKYTAEQVVETSGITRGDSLITVGRRGVSKRLKDKLPYIVGVKYKISLSGKVTVVVEETDVAFSFPIQSKEGAKQYVFTSYDGKVLEISDKNSKRATTVTGLEVTSANPGEVIELAQEGEMKKITDLNLRIKNGGFPKVTKFSIVGESYTFQFDGRYTIKLGTLTELDYKLDLAKETVEKLDSENSQQRGVIDVRDAANSRSAYFSPQ